MAAIDSDTALFTRTHSLLDSFSQQQFKGHELASSVPVRDLAKLQQHHAYTDNFTKWTQDVTSVTGYSDSGLVMDSGDRQRALEDLKVFKSHVSTLKLAYLESNAKLEFSNHIMSPAGFKAIDKEDNEKIAERRKVVKDELEVRKQRVKEIETLVRIEAEALEQQLSQREQEVSHAAQLLQECEEMEREIAMLKNKRSPTERLTIEQASNVCDEQLAELESIGQRTMQCEAEMKSLKPQIKASKIRIERLSHTAKQLQREQDERDAKGVQDERAEEACQWLDTTAQLYKSLLGIYNAYTVGSPARELVFEYELPSTDKGDLRKLSIELGEDGKMVGARLIDSSMDIQDLVDAHLDSQDLRSLVQEVRIRVGC
ncbi:hypothetical protein JCM8097_007828 [Rhodosporidiobolus ruineniae]